MQLISVCVVWNNLHQPTEAEDCRALQPDAAYNYIGVHESYIDFKTVRIWNLSQPTFCNTEGYCSKRNKSLVAYRCSIVEVL